MGFGDSNEFTLDTTDTGTGGYMGFGDSNDFALDTTETGTGGYMGTGDSNEFVLDTTDGNGTDSNATVDQLVTVSGTVFYDGVVPGAAYVWAMEANGSTAAEQILPAGEGNYTLPLPKAKLMTLRPSLMVPETDIRITGRCGNIFWTGTKPWAVSTLQVDGNLSGITI